MIESLSEFPQASASFLLPGGAGAIEVQTRRPAQAARLGTAIICHPHPLYGGSMSNKVVTTAERAFHELGLNTLRFNFRGVGKSEGTHDNGIGEGDDLMMLVQWLQRVRPDDAIWLCGFSFGAYVAITRAAAIAPAQMISLAPPIGRWPLADIVWPQCPWLVIQPEADEVVDPAAVFAWAETMGARITLLRFADTSHFFHGQLTPLREAIKQHVRAPLPTLA